MRSLFRTKWINIYEGRNPWDISQKKMVLNEFVEALHEDEKELASKFQDEKGTDWNAYILEKEKAGFCKFSEWQFMDYSHVTTQIKSKYNTKWGTRMIAVMVNNRKIDVQFFVAGFRPVKKEGHYKLYSLLHGSGNGSRHEAENGFNNCDGNLYKFLC